MRRLSLWMTVVVFSFLFAPLFLIVVVSFDTASVLSFPPEGLSLNWYATFFDNSEMKAALGRSVALALAAAVLGGVVGTAGAVLIVRYSFWGRTFINALSTLPMAMPRIILGVAILTLLNTVNLQRGWPYLLAGHAVMAIPYVLVVVSSQLYAVDVRLEEASVNLGANRLKTFFGVTLPLATPGIVAGMLFAFTVSFQDAEASLMWVSPAEPTLPIEILTNIRNELTPEINAVAVLMMVVSVGLPLIAERFLAGGAMLRAVSRTKM